MINSFDGAYRFLSNFWPCTIEYEGLIYPSTEAAYQAAKTLLITEREKFIYLAPNKAKRLGRTVKLRPDWDKVKLQVMEDVLRTKFEDPSLRAQLLGTGNEELVEGNYWHDNFYGFCGCKACENIPKQNHLGILLMKIREDLKEVSWKG